jgi:transcriptional regulator
METSEQRRRQTARFVSLPIFRASKKSGACLAHESQKIFCRLGEQAERRIEQRALERDRGLKRTKIQAKGKVGLCGKDINNANACPSCHKPAEGR